jgi:hypothetical protein
VPKEEANKKIYGKRTAPDRGGKRGEIELKGTVKRAKLYANVGKCS